MKNIPTDGIIQQTVILSFWNFIYLKYFYNTNLIYYFKLNVATQVPKPITNATIE